MNIDITDLLNGKKLGIEIDADVIFRKEDIENTTMLELKDCHVKGHIIASEENIYSISFTLKGIMTLEDAVTLEKIPYNFFIKEENDYEVGNYIKINDNFLDIYEVLWENVVLEIPIRIVKEDSLTELEGNGWSLNKKVNKDSALSELSKLLDMEEEK